MRRPVRPRLERLEARVNPVRVSAMVGNVLGDFSQPHTSTEIMASIRSADPIGELNRMTSQDARGAGLIDPDSSHVILTMNGQALVEVRLAPNANPAEAARWLAKQTRVAWTEPNAIFVGDPKDFVPNDPQYGSQYHLPKMSLPTAWDIETGNPSIVLAITDNGTAFNHPDLFQNIWVNSDEIPSNGIDDDANGFIDDRNGWDFNANDNNPNPVGSANHGTHTAGIAAAVTNNAVGVSGVAGGNGTAATGIRIMPIRWEGAAGWTASHVANSFTYAANNGAKIVSASYNFDGWASNSTVINAFNYSYGLGVLHFNSAGNNNQNNPPRSVFTQALMVSSTDANDVKSSFSNYGTFADIAAPGSSVLATSASNNGTTYSYAILSGTSMSTPNAAAVAGLIWSEHPTWTREQVAAQLLATTDNIDAQNPSFAGLLGTGRANAFRALSQTIPAPRFGTITGLPAQGANTFTAFTTFTIPTSLRLDPATVIAANFEMRGEGVDGTFNTGDDVLLPLTINAGTPYRVGTNFLTFTFSGMTPDRYRFIAKSGGLTNPFGVALDGNGDGTAGDDFVREFSFQQQISGVVVEDWDNSGTRGPNDPGLAGTTVFADFNNNGTRETNEPMAISNATGAYSFGGLPVGNTVVRQLAQSGYMITGPETLTANLPTPTSVMNNFDFSQIRNGPAVYGRVYTDTNGNGSPDSGEAGQTGRIVFWDLNNNGSPDGGEAQTTTDTLGNYRIPLVAGPHNIRLIPVAAFTATNPPNNLHTITVGTGPVAGRDFGQIASSAPSGTVTVGSGQSRSRIENLTVTFSEEVTFTNNDPLAAFSLTRTGSGPVQLQANVTLIGGQTIVTLSFLSSTQFNSLIDGRYVLTVDHTRIQDLQSNQLQPMAPTNFHRYFGDYNGDEQVDGPDLSAFSSTFGLSSAQAGFLTDLDYNDDGQIDNFDLSNFSGRYGTALP